MRSKSRIIMLSHDTVLKALPRLNGAKKWEGIQFNLIPIGNANQARPMCTLGEVVGGPYV